MSPSLTRMLRKLYPRHVRERYGDELLDLQDELRARGEISRAGLLRDAIMGAMLARSGRLRASLTLFAATAAVGLVITGFLVVSAGPTPAHPPTATPRRLAGTIIAKPEPYLCLTTESGSSCSQGACTEYVELNPMTGRIVAYRTMPADKRSTQGKCIAPQAAIVLPVGKHAPQ